jgi:hypothetical protein
MTQYYILTPSGNTPFQKDTNKEAIESFRAYVANHPDTDTKLWVIPLSGTEKDIATYVAATKTLTVLDEEWVDETPPETHTYYIKDGTDVNNNILLETFVADTDDIALAVFDKYNKSGALLILYKDDGTALKVKAQGTGGGGDKTTTTTTTTTTTFDWGLWMSTHWYFIAALILIVVALVVLWYYRVFDRTTLAVLI